MGNEWSKIAPLVTHIAAYKRLLILDDYTAPFQNDVSNNSSNLAFKDVNIDKATSESDVSPEIRKEGTTLIDESLRVNYVDVVVEGDERKGYSKASGETMSSSFTSLSPNFDLPCPVIAPNLPIEYLASILSFVQPILFPSLDVALAYVDHVYKANNSLDDEKLVENEKRKILHLALSSFACQGQKNITEQISDIFFFLSCFYTNYF